MESNSAQPEVITVPIEVREVPMYQPQETYRPPPPSTIPKKGSNTALNFFLILILLGLLGAGGYLLYKYIIQPYMKRNTTKKNEDELV